MSALNILYDYISKILSLLFSPDFSLVSDEFTDIMANKTGKEKYFKPIEKARENKQEEKIILSSGKH